jgi:hypothetical protein
MTDDGNRPSIKLGESGNQGLVVAVAAVAVQLQEVREEHPDIIQRVRPMGVARDLGALPGTEMAVKFLPKLKHLLADAFELRVGLFVAGEVAQLFNVFFQALDLRLTIGLRRRDFCFVLGLHHITKSIDCSPNDSRIALTNSGHERTRCST